MVFVIVALAHATSGVLQLDGLILDMAIASLLSVACVVLFGLESVNVLHFFPLVVW